MDILKKIELFADTPEAVLNQLWNTISKRTYEKDEVIIQKGDAGDSMFIISSGKVKVHDYEHAFSELTEGNFFGELSLLDSEPRTRTVTTLEPTEVLCIKQNDFYEVMIHQPEVMKAIIHVLTRRLRNQNKVLSDEYKNREQELTELVEQRTLDLKLKNEELIAALQRLKDAEGQLVHSEKMASLGQLTAGIAHEINNPINFITANIAPLKRDIEDTLAVLSAYQKETLGLNKTPEAELLTEDLDLPYSLKEIPKLIEGIEEGASRTAQIVKNLKNFSRLDENDRKTAWLEEGLDSTLMLLRSRLELTNITVEKFYRKTPLMLCYPGQLNQVFMNLLSNAIDALDEVGIITITTGTEDDMAFVSIRDNGPGIPQEIQSKIFEPFFTTKEVGKGTGLGLSISYGIIEKHNGTLEVTSVENEGTQFLIKLPILAE